MQGLATISSMLTDELESENSDPPPEAKLTSLFPPPPVLSIHLVIIGPLLGEYLKNKKKDGCCNLMTEVTKVCHVASLACKYIYSLG